MNHPDEDLPELQISIQEFVILAQNLSKPGQELEKFIRFVLAGRLQMNDRLFRIFVNARQGVAAPLPSDRQTYGDIDSAIGINRDLPFTSSMAIFPIAAFRDTLTKDNHLKYSLTHLEGTPNIPIHKIPNMALGTVHRRHITRIFFPRMYQRGESPALSTETRTLIYKQCLRPAVLDINPIDQSRYPITYSAAMTLYRDNNGHFHFGTIDFPSRLLSKLATKLLGLFQEHEGLQDAFFVHELRGTKGVSHHDPQNAEERRRALDDVFRIFDAQLLKADEWVIDIAIEVRQSGHVLQWLTNGHRRILEFLLPSAIEGKIDAILASKSQYLQDLSAQLGDIGGFRALPASRGKADGVLYINVYTTDKSATYQLHDGIFKRRKPWHLFPGVIEKLVTDLEKITDTFRDCGDTAGGLEGNARMEIRVPLRLADKVLVDIPDALFQNTLVSYECPTFWWFKYYRMAALYHVVENLQSANRITRIKPVSLSLGALVTYQINALIYRPAEGRSEDILLKAACQHVLNDENTATHPIMYGRGVYFMSDITSSDGTYRLPDARIIGEDILVDLYRRDFLEDIEAEFDEPLVPNKALREPPTRRSRKRTIAYVLHASSSGEDDEAEGGDVPETPRNVGGTAASEFEELVVDPRTTTRLSDIKRCFASDIIQLAPNPKSNLEQPWILLDHTQKEQTKINIFRSQDISEVFSQAQYRIMSGTDWKDMVFRRYFPAKGATMAKALQHFPSASYYMLWEALMNRLDEDKAKITRDHILNWFDTLRWVPHPEADRMWSTREATGRSWVRVPPGPAQNCPRLALNPRFGGGLGLNMAERPTGTG